MALCCACLRRVAGVPHPRRRRTPELRDDGAAGGAGRPASATRSRPPGQTSEGITGPSARQVPPHQRSRTVVTGERSWQVSPGVQLPPLEPDQRPRQDPRPPAHGQPAPGRASRWTTRTGATSRRGPRSPAAGPRRRGRRHQRRLLRHLRHRGAARRRPRPAAGHAARVEVHLAQRVLRDPGRAVPDRAADADRPDRAVPPDRDHQRELPAGPGGKGRDLRPRLGTDLRLPDHRRPAEAGPDGRDPGRPGGREPDHAQQRPSRSTAWC